MTEQQICRKQFLAGAAIGVAGVALPAVARAAGKTRRPVFRLSPSAGICDGPRGTCACKACYGHTNKLFPSISAADGNRAHPYCNCGIETAAMIPYGTWVALFGNPRHIRRSSVDLRHRNVAEILKRVSLVA